MKKLYIGNISYQTSEETLRNVFSMFTSIKSVKIITDKFSGESRGFGFVDFENDEEAQQAIEAIDGYELDGKALRVNEARPKNPSANNNRGGGYRGRGQQRAGQFGGSGRGNGGRGGFSRGNNNGNRGNFRSRKPASTSGQE